MGDVHQARSLHKQLSVALLAMTSVCGWSLYQIPPDVSASTMKEQLHCYADDKMYSVGSAKRMLTGEIRECLSQSSGAAPYWHEIERSRLH
ncbi:hypothetical protein SAMN04515620_11963 [Collimonas sp. OK607]|nr:hypothetical protein SAMN04515620_11963 [Collimonas sp. OK607]